MLLRDSTSTISRLEIQEVLLFRSRGLYAVKEPGTGGEDNTAGDTITSLATVDFGVTDPEGVAYAPGLDHLFIADGVKRDLRAVAWELSETEAV